MLLIDILRNFSQNFLGVLTEFRCPEVCFFRVWVSKRHPDALLAKTMVPGMVDRWYLLILSL